MTAKLAIATFNLKSDFLCFGANSWPRRRERIFRQLVELDADIAGLQELTPRMRADFESEMAGYNLVGRGRSHLFCEHSDIAVRGGIAIHFHHTFWLSKHPGRAGSSIASPLYPLSWIFPRICTVAELTLPGSGTRIRVFNTHLDVLSETARYIQLGIICRCISAYQQRKALPTLLMGDFNAAPDSRSIRALTENAFGCKNVRLRDILADSMAGTLHFFRGGEGRQRIDYIFASEEFSVDGVQIIKSSYDGLYPSDHYPILASLRVKEAST